MQCEVDLNDVGRHLRLGDARLDGLLLVGHAGPLHLAIRGCGIVREWRGVAAAAARREGVSIGPAGVKHSLYIGPAGVKHSLWIAPAGVTHSLWISVAFENGPQVRFVPDWHLDISVLQASAGEHIACIA
jgi:hypothetical protein